MLAPLRYSLKSKTIILASGSARRKEILEKNLGLDILVVPSKFPEDLDKSKFKTPADYVVENSRLKVVDVNNNLKTNDWFMMIGADTVVFLDNIIYEKPVDKNDAFNMLKKLSGKTHQVTTGVTLVKKSATNNHLIYHSFSETTDVTFAALDDETITAYVETGEPMDKAGSYGCQGLGCSLVKSIKGDFFNVVGFPAHKFSVELKKFLDRQEAIEEEIDQDEQGGFVVPLSYCPHLEEINQKLDDVKFIDAKRSCGKCNDTLENWLCLTCYECACSRYVKGHMLEHSKENKHPMALSFSDCSVWCFVCDSYVHNNRLMRCKEIAYKSKFE